MSAWIKFKSLFQPAAAEVLAAQEYDEALAGGPQCP